jgi:hypothetical protein
LTPAAVNTSLKCSYIHPAQRALQRA